MLKTLIKISSISCLCFALGLSAQVGNQLPKLGEAAGATLSIAKEQQIGDQIMSQIRGSRFLMQDPLVNDYIQQIGYRLVAANPDALGRSFRFFIIQEASINAFALPGGYIGIHSGLITASRSESELASVLGHEVAHVTQRHLARRLEKQNQISLPTILASIGAILVATQNPDAGVGALSATQAASQQSIISHTRDNEKEADRIGIAMLSGAGFDVRAAADFFETLSRQSRYVRKPPEILLTHPLSENRKNDAERRARLYPNVEHQSSIDYQLVKARIKSLENQSNEVYFSQFKSKANKPESSIADQYQYAELLKSRGNNQKAINILDKLYQKMPNNHIVLYSLSEAHLANNSSKAALPLLQQQLHRNPGNTKLVLATANAYMSMQQPQKAESLLLRYADLNKTNPNYLFALAKSQQESNHIPEMHETTGQYMVLVGQYKNAKKHFELALGHFSEDPYAQTRIQARLQNVRQKLRELIENKNRRS
ncbi:M48 family metalloprotease [Kangiella sp. HZ709]|uniref:beta-barrel assembly-enhancing protease n=1 Tax=Kangiella sp. HZ709 TaxID=2666328 RepID=UPI0012B09280|nr:M48 family metalloprotease [Kangiella sp. HZ709]MRX27076.1 M48 family metalloprotease [Kangiella sp. HZ709]